MQLKGEWVHHWSQEPLKALPQGVILPDLALDRLGVEDGREGKTSGQSGGYSSMSRA